MRDINKSTFIDDVLLELSMRVDNGMPDLNDKAHLKVLREILIEWNVDETFIRQYIKNIKDGPVETIYEVDLTGDVAKDLQKQQKIDDKKEKKEDDEDEKKDDERDEKLNDKD
jgi:hypothetical protein